MPASMSDPMKQLLTGLLQKDPGSRLGCRGRSSEEVKGMAFFATTNWDDVMDKKVYVWPKRFITFVTNSSQSYASTCLQV